MGLHNNQENLVITNHRALQAEENWKIIDSKYKKTIKNTDVAILVQYCAETLEIFFLKEATNQSESQKTSDPV